MPILFKPEFVDKILSGEKTVTRRMWARSRVKVGRVYQARTKMFGEPFARLRIVQIYYEIKPGSYVCYRDDDLETEARKEGFRSWHDFKDTFAELNKPDSLEEPCIRVEFEVVK